MEPRKLTFRGEHAHTAPDMWLAHLPGAIEAPIEVDDRITYTVSYPVNPFNGAASSVPSEELAETPLCEGGELACPCSASL